MKTETGIQEFVKDNFEYSELLPFQISQVQIPKNTYFVVDGQKEDYLYFLVNGIVENGMNRNEENHIIEFFFPGQFFTALIPFITRTPCDVYFLALTDCVIERVYYKDLARFLKTSLIVNRLLRHITEQALMQRIKKEKQISSLSAEEMYLELIQTRPYLLDRKSVV